MGTFFYWKGLLSRTAEIKVKKKRLELEKDIDELIAQRKGRDEKHKGNINKAGDDEGEFQDP